MRFIRSSAILTLAFCSQADAQKSDILVSFCAMGDVPYLPYEDELLPLQIEDLPTDVSFAVHVGDIKAGGSPCDAAVYQKVAAMLAKSTVPMFVLPGDNEWNDCSDPTAAWALWVKHLNRFDRRWKPPFAVERGPNHEENFAFVRNGVLFIGVNVVGGKVHNADEWKQRHSNCASWVKENFAKHGDDVSSTVLFGHATPSPTQSDFFNELNSLALEFEKPILYLHGDGHVWVKNRPFEAKNILRVQVDQGRLGPPVRISVSEDPNEPFQFDRRLETQPIVRQYAIEEGTHGPEKGSLVIVGGAGGVEGAKIFKRFVELAGGEKAKILVVPTASSSGEKTTAESFRKARIREGGIEPASLAILHTRDPKEADTEEFVAPIREATGIWFSGGRQWRLVDSYGDTLAEQEFRAVLERGGAIGGSSAGATIQGSFLARGDTTGNTIMLGDHQRGFAYLTNATIDQHVVARGRELDLIEVLTDPESRMEPGHEKKSLMGFGVDEDTAMVVTGDHFEVIGKPSGAVLVYDPTSWAKGLPAKQKFLRLGPGSIYDMNLRKPIKHLAPAPPPPKKPVSK